MFHLVSFQEVLWKTQDHSSPHCSDIVFLSSRDNVGQVSCHKAGQPRSSSYNLTNAMSRHSTQDSSDNSNKHHQSLRTCSSVVKSGEQDKGSNTLFPGSQRQRCMLCLASSYHHFRDTPGLGRAERQELANHLRYCSCVPLIRDRQVGGVFNQ